MDSGLNGSHVYITGASGGIGLVTAELFLKEGANVTLHYNSTYDTLKELVESYPEQVHTTQANVTNEEAVIASVQSAIDRFGMVNAMVINHGIWIADAVPLWEMTLDQWNKTISIDLTGAFLFAREYLKQLKGCSPSSTNNSIIFVGSTAGHFGEADHADYATSKAGLMYGMTKSLKNEIIRLHPRGRINSVMPGWVATPMAEDSLKDTKVVNKVLSTMALRKVATPEDIGNSILFLASEKLSGHISGDVFSLAGGMEGRLLHPETL